MAENVKTGGSKGTGANYYIGIDLGGTNIVVGVVDQNGILAKTSCPTQAERPWQKVVADMEALCHQASAMAGISLSAVEHVGVGIPGIANKDTGIAEFVTNLFWHDVPVGPFLSERLGKSVIIDNDANAAAFGEYGWGAGNGTGIFLAVTLGTGIGGGLIYNGNIFTGFNYAGLEVGHMVIHRGGRPCTCGRSGCFERYASASGLIATAKEGMMRKKDSLLWRLTDGDPERLDGKMPFDAADMEDPAARDIIRTYMTDLACGLASLINIFQPDILCLGGGIATQGKRLIEPVSALISEEVYSRKSPHNTKLVTAKLGNDAGLIGAANLHLAAAVSQATHIKYR